MKEEILKIIDRAIANNEKKTAYKIALTSKYAIREVLKKLKKKVSRVDAEAMAEVNVEVRHFTYDEVKTILCEGCSKKLPDLRECDEQKWYHTINGEKILCAANDWKNKVNA